MKDKSHSQFTSSRPEAFCKKSVLRNFAKFSGKHLCQSLFLIKRLWCRCFPVNFAKFLRTPILAEHLRWLLTILAKPQHENCPKMEFFSGPYFPVFSPSIGKYGPEKKKTHLDTSRSELSTEMFVGVPATPWFYYDCFPGIF